MKHDGTPARCMTTYLDRSPVDRRLVWPQRLENRLLGGKAHSETLGDRGSDGRLAVRGFTWGEHAPHVPFAEALERAADVAYADDINADLDPHCLWDRARRQCVPRPGVSRDHNCRKQQAGCHLGERRDVIRRSPISCRVLDGALSDERRTGDYGL